MLQVSPVHPQSALVRQWLSASAREIARSRGYASGGIAAAHRHLARATEGRCVLEVDDPSRFGAFGAGEVRLGETAIRLLTCDSATVCRNSTRRPPSRNHVVLQCVLDGHFDVMQGNRHARVNAGQALVTGSVGNTVKQWRGACALLNLVMPRDALGRLARAADPATADLDQPAVEFGRMTVLELGRAVSLAHFIGAVVSDLSDSGGVFHQDRVAAETERALHLLVCKSLAARNGEAPALSSQRPSTAAPFYVRRAETFMRAHLARALSLTTLAEAAGVSPRTLQYGFRLYRQATPMDCLRRLRLAAAREALLEAALTGLRIGEIAAACGYVSLSHFSRDYRACFGESPSATLRAG
jgi:AraC-like DNA-binding protein